MIDDDIKHRIIQSTDIVDIVAEVVQLKRTGRNFVGLCPFHDEKTGSFHVMQDRGFYKCFGCGASGDAIKFMMEYHGLTFVESLKELARRAGIVIPEDNTKYDKKKASEREKIMGALAEAHYYFSSTLKSPAGRKTLEYFKSRGFRDSVIKQFGLGYSPDSWNALRDHLQKKEFPVEVQEGAGLVIKSDKGSYYDRFRTRAMFPIHDFMGKIIGFGARTMDKDPKSAKYINSPQTKVYDKSSVLYGLFFAKTDIRSKSEAIMVEGYADVISLHQAGIKNVVASSGTALTTQQLQILARMCKKLFLIYDADKAGIAATEKAIDLALPMGFDVRVVNLPGGEDPDSLVRDKGSAIFLEYLENYKNFIEFKIDRFKQDNRLESPSGKSECARELTQLISKIPDNLQHDEYLQMLATKLSLSENQVQILYKEIYASSGKSSGKTTGTKQEAPRAVVRRQAIEPIGEQQKMLPEEYMILNLMLTNREAVRILNDEYDFSPDICISDAATRLMTILFELINETGDLLSAVVHDETSSEDDKSLLTEIACSSKYPKTANPGIEASKNWEKYTSQEEEEEDKLPKLVSDTLRRLELTRCRMDLNKIKKELQETTDNGILIDKLKQQMKLQKKIEELNTTVID